MGPMSLKLHYRVDPLLEHDNLKDAVEGSSKNVNFLNNKLGKMLCSLTMNSLNKDLDVYFLTNWKSVFSSLLSMKVAFKAIVYICD
jgi:hypothetical protein